MTMKCKRQTPIYKTWCKVTIMNRNTGDIVKEGYHPIVRYTKRLIYLTDWASVPRNVWMKSPTGKNDYMFVRILSMEDWAEINEMHSEAAPQVDYEEPSV